MSHTVIIDDCSDVIEEQQEKWIEWMKKLSGLDRDLRHRAEVLEMTDTLQMLDLDKLEAGPETDQLMAEEVMGWVLGEPEVIYGPMMGGRITIQKWVGSTKETPQGRITRILGSWQPSTNISNAWEVVEKLYNDGWQFSLEIYRGEGACAGFFRSRNEFGEIDCAYASVEENKTPLAICRAVLKTIKATEKK